MFEDIWVFGLKRILSLHYFGTFDHLRNFTMKFESDENCAV